MSSFGRRIAGLINADGTVKQSKIDDIETSEVSSVISSEVVSGVSYFDTLDSLPTTGVSGGLKALVNISSTEGRLYVYNGQGWYNSETNLNTSTPVWATEPNATYDIVDSSTPLTITALAIDSDGDPIINQSFVSDSAQYMVDITNDSSVWTFTPKSADSIGIEVDTGNLTDSNGDFIYTFKWSDGTNFISKAVTIGYNPSALPVSFFGDRAIFNQGDYASASPTYQAFAYASISTPANAVGFANSVKGRDPNNGNMSNGTRGVFTEGSYEEGILYLTIPTLSSVSDFGNLSAQNAVSQYATHWGGASASNGIRGFIVGDADANTNADLQEAIFYITIDTLGNAVNFGIDFAIHTARGAAVSDDTYIVAGGGIVPSGLGDVAAGSSDEVKGLGYFTAMTASSSTSFGNLAIARPYLAGCSNETRGVFAGGEGNNLGGAPNSDYMIEDIETITVATPSNSSQFGDLRRKRARFGLTCNGTHGVTSGGQYQPGVVHVFSGSYEMDYFSMETAGTATDFGDVYGNQTNDWTAASGHAA